MKNFYPYKDSSFPIFMLHLINSSFLVLHSSLNTVIFVLSRIVKHGCTNTELTVLGHENVMVGTCFTTLPESLIVGQLIEGYRHITQFGIHLHHRTTAGQAEQLCLRPTQAGQTERSRLDTLGQAQATVLRMNNQT